MEAHHLSYYAEQQVDAAVRRGHFRHAHRLARQAIDTFTTDEHKIAIDHFIRLKEVALPFYKARHELFRFGEISAKTMNEAEAVHGESIELIRDNLEKFKHAEGTEKQRYKGAVSENVVFALGARGFNLQAKRFMVPSFANANMRSSDPIDFEVIWLPAYDNNYEIRVTPIQVKTDLKAPHVTDTESSVPTVGMRQIDDATKLMDHYRIDDERALPGQLIREIDATATYKDIEQLDKATRELYEQIYGSSAAA